MSGTARDFQKTFDVKRPIYIDGLDGACHRAFGSMPNMSWIVDRGRRPVYKAAWTDADSVRSAIADLWAMRERRRSERQILAPFHVERLDYRINDRQAFIEGLKLSGQKAVDEFVAQTQRWQSE